MAEPARGEPRYRAFLSYSHKDAAAAARIHRRLESYRLPKRLVGRESERGPVPPRLCPIFRDREEFAASADLSEAVRAGLAESGALIVLCSADAVASRWVAEEIRTFRQLRPGAPVLAAIIAGEPPACFPEPLLAAPDGTRTEPLATDLRREGDGPRLGLLKLVGGLTGVGLDELVQRDATRRVRRVTAVTGIAVAAMLIMAVLTVFAIDARREADRQRAEAEGLIEFMLTDLRSRLRQVGRLDAMEAVNARAMLYYGGQHDNASKADTKSVLRRARVLHAIAEDEITVGNILSARNAVAEAHRITNEQLSGNPRDPARLLHHARSEFWTGRVYELRQVWPAAEHHYVRFADIMERLVDRNPRNREYVLGLAWSALDRANVQLRGRRDLHAARHSYQKAVAWFRQALELEPRDTEAALALANAYAWLADSFFADREWQSALQSRREQYDIVERLHRANPSDAMSEFRFAAAQNGLGRTLHKTGDRAGARAQMYAAYNGAKRLAQRDPRNAEWLLFKASVECGLYYLDLGFPPMTTRASFARAIRSTAAALAAQRNPRLQEISNCVESL